MQPVSNAFLELMKSNIRPKVEPTVKVKDALGTGRDLVWSGNNISNLKYKRGIDPLGRTLPFMELRWEEIYQGNLNEDGYVELYKNIAAFLPVQLSFDQSLDFTNTWKTIFESGQSWKDILDSKKTWKDVKDQPQTERFDFPILFLAGKPTVKNQTIEWVAYDLMHYLEMPQTKFFDSEAILWDIPKILLKNCCASHLNDGGIIASIKKTIENIPVADFKLQSDTVFDGETNSLLKDYLAFYNFYWDFKSDYMVTKVVSQDEVTGNFEFYVDTGFEFPLSLQYDFPVVTKNANVSAYQFKQYYCKENAQNQKEVAWDSYKSYTDRNGRTIWVAHYVFDGYGKAVQVQGSESSINSDITEAYAIIPSEPTSAQQYMAIVNTIEQNSVDLVINNNAEGEPYVSDNKFSIKRTDSEGYYNPKTNAILKRYFNTECDSLEIECAPNVALETGDLIKIETNLRDGFGNRIKKNAFIVENSLEYSGKLTQKIKAHEVRL